MSENIPIGAWRILARREGRSFTRFGGKMTDAGPVEAGTRVTVEDIDGNTAYVRTEDGRRLRVMRDALIQRSRGAHT